MTSPSTIAAAGDSPPMLLDRRDLARELRTSEKTIARMIAAGKLPMPVFVGRGRRRWPRSVIVEWIAEGCPNGRDFARRCEVTK